MNRCMDRCTDGWISYCAVIYLIDVLIKSVFHRFFFVFLLCRYLASVLWSVRNADIIKARP